MEPPYFKEPYPLERRPYPLERQPAYYDLRPTFSSRKEAPMVSVMQEKPPVVIIMGPPAPKRRKLNAIVDQPNTQLSDIVARSLPQTKKPMSLSLAQCHQLIDTGRFAAYLRTGKLNPSFEPDHRKTADDRLLSLTKRALKLHDAGLYQAICTFMDEQEAPFRYYQDFVRNPKRLPAMQDLLEKTFDNSILCTQELTIQFRQKTVATIYINAGMKKSSYPLLDILEDIFQLDYLDSSPPFETSGGTRSVEFNTENLNTFLAVLKLLHCGKIEITRSNFQRLFMVHRHLKDSSLEYGLLEEKLLEWVFAEKEYFAADWKNSVRLLDVLFIPRPSLEQETLDRISVLLPEDIPTDLLHELLTRYQHEEFGLFILRKLGSQTRYLSVVLDWLSENTDLSNKKLWQFLSNQYENSTTADVVITISEAQGVAVQRPGHLSILALQSGFFRAYKRGTAFAKKDSLKMFEILTSSERPLVHELPYNPFVASKILEFCYRGPLTITFLEECLLLPHGEEDIPFLILSYADILAIDSFKIKLTKMIDRAFSSEEKDLLDLRSSEPLALGSNHSQSSSSPSLSYNSRNLLRAWLPAALFFQPQFQETGTLERIFEFLLEDLKKLTEPELSALTTHSFIDFIKKHSSYLKQIPLPKETSLDFLRYLLSVCEGVEEIRLKKPCEPLCEYMNKLEGWKETPLRRKQQFYEVVFTKVLPNVL